MQLLAHYRTASTAPFGLLSLLALPGLTPLLWELRNCRIDSLSPLDAIPQIFRITENLKPTRELSMGEAFGYGSSKLRDQQPRSATQISNPDQQPRSATKL
uniref:Uncharacterized protein n=1 Tax=Physcomitrium patens TaxID=3218 RepID=A0A2K1K5W2_PHYPA|nr:hypothetical protein PHYPA_011054 [Physcomitrium patens]